MWTRADKIVVKLKVPLKQEWQQEAGMDTCSYLDIFLVSQLSVDGNCYEKEAIGEMRTWPLMWLKSHHRERKMNITIMQCLSSMTSLLILVLETESALRRGTYLRCLQKANAGSASHSCVFPWQYCVYR